MRDAAQVLRERGEVGGAVGHEGGVDVDVGAVGEQSPYHVLSGDGRRNVIYLTVSISIVKCCIWYMWIVDGIHSLSSQLAGIY